MKQLSELSRPLEIHQIDFRVQSINSGGYATVLAYKDARVDMDRLDDVCGVGFWQRKHDIINGQLFCSVGVWNADITQWVWVQDVGTESNTEAEKGRASDSFKRACFNLGIGRELYAFPEIKVKLDPEEFEVKEYQGKKKAQATWKLNLKSWLWYMERDEGGITFLAAKDADKVRFKYGTRRTTEGK
jgi:hypothetical protein